MRKITKKQIKVLEAAYRIIKKEYGYPKSNCEANAFGCWQCRVKIWMREFEYVIEDFKELASLKPWKPKKKK